MKQRQFVTPLERKRTRHQWEKYYKTSGNKKITRDSGGRENKVVKEPIIIDLEDDDDTDTSMERTVKRGRNKYPKSTSGIRKGEKDVKLDTTSKVDDVETDFKFLGVEVLRNGFTSKSNQNETVDDDDDTVLCNSGKDEKKTVDVDDDDDDDINIDDGSPKIKPLEEDLLQHNVISLDSDNDKEYDTFANSSESESESESSSEEEEEYSTSDEDTSDEDFKAEQDSSSDDSYDSDCDGNDKKSSTMNGNHVKRSFNRRNQDDNVTVIGRKDPSEKKKGGFEEEIDSEEEDVVFIVDYGKKSSAQKSSRINGEKKFSGLEILVNCEKYNRERSKVENFSSPLKPIPYCKEVSSSSSTSEPKSVRNEAHISIEHVQKSVQNGSKEAEKHRKKKNTHAVKDADLIKTLEDAIDSLKEEASSAVKDNIPTPSPAHTPLPMKFWFGHKGQPLPEKSEWQKEMDSLFSELDLGLQESQINCVNSSVIEDKETDKCSATLDGQGEHELIIDDQIGVMCKCCNAVIVDIKHILPPFYTPPPRRQGLKQYDESPTSVLSNLECSEDIYGSPNSFTPTEGTVWELIPGVQKQMYPHQRKGFEFMWRNLTGDIRIDKLKFLSDDGSGCIISHAPGTGKTRLTLMFLQSFMMLFPTSRPVILAPKGMLRTWEEEFLKWNVNLDFHNLNSKDLSMSELQHCRLGGVGKSTEYIRMVKLYSWLKGRSVLGISYNLFANLATENAENVKIKELLLKRPGLLVLDEGHTPRNEQSRLWNALKRVSTQRRIILSGTPFQNNFTELKNTLCLVVPKFIDELDEVIEPETSHERRKNKRGRKSNGSWMNLTSSIGKDEDEDEGLKKLQKMIRPFVHVHKGSILQKSLPGQKETIVLLHPSQLQEDLLNMANEVKNIFERTRLVSLISIHPSTVAESKIFRVREDDIKMIGSSLDAGVKANFIMNLINFADALNERVLIFSQYLDSLNYIKNRLDSDFGWKVGREVLYMDGSCDAKQRQESIASLNDFSSNVKVLLASERSCSEGINLVGASRVVLLDTVWNPSVEKQAIRRAYRLGQKKVVYVYRLMVSGFEDRPFKLSAEKDRIGHLLFNSKDEESCVNNEVVLEDKVLERILGNKTLSSIIKKTIPVQCDDMMLGLVDL